MATTEGHSGPARNWVWRMIQLPTAIFFRVWAPLTVEGLEKVDQTQPGLFIANHQSYLDPLILAVRLRRPVSYVARDSLFKIPFIGWVLRSTYVTPISRTAARAATIRAAVSRLEEGFIVGIFPEGTRSTGEVKDFRPGVAAILRRTSVPVYPIGVAGADRVLPRGGLFARPRRIRLVIGDPISPEVIRERAEAGSKEELVSFVREHVVNCYAEAQARITRNIESS